VKPTIHRKKSGSQNHVHPDAQRKLSTPFFTQRKPKIGPANDSYEQEADRVADSVVRGETNVMQSRGISHLQRSGTRADEDAQANFFSGVEQVQKQEEEEEAQAKPLNDADHLQRQEEEEEEAQPKRENPGSEIQRQPMEEEEEEAQPKREAADREVQRQPVQEEEEPLQMQAEEEEEAVQTKTQHSQSTTASPRFYNQLAGSKGSGSPLQRSTQAEMSSGIGADFSNVRIHTDSRAAEMSRNIQAKAFTVGNHIYFNKGEYNPQHAEGKRLLAHELTHTVQQGAVQRKVIQRDPPKSGGTTKTKVAISAQQKMWQDLASLLPGNGHKLAGSAYDKSIAYLKADFTEVTSGKKRISAPTMVVGPAYANESDKSIRKAKLKTEMEKVDKFRVEKGRLSDEDVKDAYVNQLIDAMDQTGMQNLIAKLKTRSKLVANTKIIAHINAKAVMLAKIAAAKNDLVTTFKVQRVADASSKWTLNELKMLKDALNMLPKGDKSVLEGMDILRVRSLGGNTAGLFKHEVGGVSDGGVSFTHSRKIKIADLAFKGSNAEAKRLIIHEVGHGIAHQKLHKANIAVAEATVNLNKSGAKADDSNSRLTAANKILNPAVQALNDKIKEYNNEKDAAKRKAIKKQIEPLRRDYEAKKAVSEKLLKENKADVKAHKKAKKSLAKKEAKASALRISAKDIKAIKKANDRAKTSHDKLLSTAKTAAAKLDQSDADIKSYHDAVMNVSTEVASFHSDTLAQDKDEKQVEKLFPPVDSSIEKRNKSRASLVAAKKGTDMMNALQPLETAQDKLYDTSKRHSLAKDRTKKVQEFVKFVEANNIAAGTISAYAAENWPHNPEEFYAEAYSFWVTKQLAAKSAKLNKWFTKGRYK
jgi:hypothetical protein